MNEFGSTAFVMVMIPLRFIPTAIVFAGMMVLVLGGMTIRSVVMRMLGNVTILAVVMLVLACVRVRSVVMRMFVFMRVRTVMMFMVAAVPRGRSAASLREEKYGDEDRRKRAEIRTEHGLPSLLKAP